MELDIVVKLGRHLVVECDFVGGLVSYVYFAWSSGLYLVGACCRLGLESFPI